MIIKSDQEKVKHVKQLQLPPLVVPRPKRRKPKRVPARVAKVDTTRQELEQALQRIGELEQQLAEEREARYAEGYEKGRQEGYDQGVGEVRHNIEQFARFAETLRSQQADMVRQAEDFIARFAMEIATRVVGEAAAQTLRVDAPQLLDLVRSAAREFAESPRYEFRLHPENVPVFEAHRQEIGEALAAEATLAVTADPTLSPGDCVLETDFGTVDGRLATRLRQIEMALLEPEHE